MILGVLKEAGPEQRVSILPEHIKKLLDLGYSEVWIEKGAGASSFQDDSSYSTAGASIKSRKEVLEDAEVILSIQTPEEAEISPDKILVTQMNPLSHPETAQVFAKKGVSVFSMDMVPRT
ncbi:MAG: NAD(P)(+) transhydrogenase (Re/Si-specific) subunit alpha, partial [Bacteroidota bacterium]